MFVGVKVAMVVLVALVVPVSRCQSQGPLQTQWLGPKVPCNPNG